MRLATLYGVKPTGEFQHIGTNTAEIIRDKWKTHNPEHFEKIGFFDSDGRQRVRKVILSKENEK